MIPTQSKKGKRALHEREIQREPGIRREVETEVLEETGAKVETENEEDMTLLINHKLFGVGNNQNSRICNVTPLEGKIQKKRCKVILFMLFLVFFWINTVFVTLWEKL